MHSSYLCLLIYTAPLKVPEGASMFLFRYAVKPTDVLNSNRSAYSWLVILGYAFWVFGACSVEALCTHALVITVINYYYYSYYVLMKYIYIYICICLFSLSSLLLFEALVKHGSNKSLIKYMFCVDLYYQFLY